MQRRGFMAAAAGLAVPTMGRAATDFPTRSLRLVIPFSVGGSTDVLARLCGEILTKALGRSVVAENVTGAGGVIGAQRVLGYPADGYTLLAATPGPIVINPVLLAHIQYDPLRDFAATAFVGASPAVIVVRQDSPIHTLKQLIEQAKANPAKLTFASAGVGSFGHLSGELFAWKAGISLTHVPYRGAAPAITDLLGGRIDLMFENYPSVAGNLHAGQIRAIAIGTAKPSAFLPGVPTAIEAGVPGYESASWFGLLVRAGTPATVIEKLNATINEGLTTPSVRDTLSKLGVEAVGGTPAAFQDYIGRRLAEMKQLAQAMNISLH